MLGFFVLVFGLQGRGSNVTEGEHSALLLHIGINKWF